MTTRKKTRKGALSTTSERTISRAQAIESGKLIDVSEMARAVGITVPVAVTAEAWRRLTLEPDAINNAVLNEYRHGYSFPSGRQTRHYNCAGFLVCGTKPATKAVNSILPSAVEHQDEPAMLCDLLNTFYYVARFGLKGDTVLLEVLVSADDTACRMTTFKAVCGLDDTSNPVITIMLPYER